jgi:non-specific serine/threonine protein kinase
VEQGEQTPGSPDFGKLLRRHRIAAKLSQEALAERARISVNGLSSLERSIRRNPRRETLALLSDALALDAEQRRQFELAASLSIDGRRGQSVTIGPWTSPAVVNLPFTLTSFVGRDSELAEIRALVRAHRMVTLTGAGGVGKTQTALHVASSLEESAQDPVFFVGLAPISNPSQVVPAIASTLGVQQVPNRSLLETVTTQIKNRAPLMILDNCEHVITEVAVVVNALLTACPRVRILATSRESLRAAGEYAYRLPTLEVPSPGAALKLVAGDALGYASIVLFRDRASAADHRFELTDENAPLVAEICRRLDGIPLAIELAAARASQLPLRAIAEKLGDRLRVLIQGSRTALPRQQTMRATIDWSYDLLDPSEQRAFERLSVFGGGCTLEAATSVCGDDEASTDDVFDTLSSLIAKSLLVVSLDGREPRYHLLESFRQYAREKLAIRGESGLAANRHALAYQTLAQRSGIGDIAPDDGEPRTELIEERDNWRGVLHWSLVERGDILLGQDLAASLCGIWGKTRSPIEGRYWLTLAKELVDERTPASMIARLRYAEAQVAWYLDETENQLESSAAAIALYNAINDTSGIARSESLAGQALLVFGRAAEARSVLNDALKRARELHHYPLIAFVLRDLGAVSASENDIGEARRYLTEALAIYQAEAKEHGDGYAGVNWALIDLSEYEFRGGNTEVALSLATRVATTQGASSRLVATALNMMALCLIVLDQYDEAENCARDALDRECEHHWEVMITWTLQHLAAIVAFRPYEDTNEEHVQHTRAAKIIGFVDARLAALGSSASTSETAPEYDRLLSVLRASLRPETLTMLMALGAEMDEAHAIEAALG